MKYHRIELDVCGFKVFQWTWTWSTEPNSQAVADAWTNAAALMEDM